MLVHAKIGGAQAIDYRQPARRAGKQPYQCLSLSRYFSSVAYCVHYYLSRSNLMCYLPLLLEIKFMYLTSGGLARGRDSQLRFEIRQAGRCLPVMM